MKFHKESQYLKVLGLNEFFLTLICTIYKALYSSHKGATSYILFDIGVHDH